MNEWLPRCLPVLIADLFLLCVRPIRLQNILYHVCFDNTDSLPGDDVDDDDDDTGDISTCDVEATCDEVAEIWRKQVIWYNAIMCHVFFWKLIVYTFISWCCSGKYFNKYFCMLILSKLISFLGKFNIIIYII